MLPESLFFNPAWHALQTKHRDIALSNGAACRYPADIAPFAALAEPSAAALGQLDPLLAPGESVWLFGENFPSVPHLAFDHTIECVRMFLPGDVTPPEPVSGILDLTAAHADEMVALTDLAFSGFFRPRTHKMGSYHGIRSDNRELIAMAGERLMLEGYPEISAVCTHPDHRGRGHAASLMWHLIRAHRRQHLTSWLHVLATNHSAIALYRRMGFQTGSLVILTYVTKASAAA